MSITSKNILTDNGYIVGVTITKDMDNSDFTNEMTPTNYNNLFPGLASIEDGNIVVGDKDISDKNNGSYWGDWGNDLFDDWG